MVMGGNLYFAGCGFESQLDTRAIYYEAKQDQNRPARIFTGWVWYKKKKNIKPSPVGSGMKSRCQPVRVRLSQHPTRPGTLPSLLWSDFQLEISIWKDWACWLILISIKYRSTSGWRCNWLTVWYNIDVSFTRNEFITKLKQPLQPSDVSKSL